MADPLRVLLHNDVTAPMEARLRDALPEVQVAGCTSYAALPEVLAGFQPDVLYSVRFDGSAAYPRDAVFGPGGPRWVSNGGAGVDHFGQWDPARVTVTNAAGVAADMMAEYVMGCFLHFTLDIAGLQADQAARRWRARMMRPLLGKTLVIVGLGHTGQAIAARAKGFGMTVLGIRARPCNMAHVNEVAAPEALHDLLRRADCVAVSTPLTDRTRGMIGTEAIAAMGPQVLFADVSRGGVTDQSALRRALEEGRIAGAAVDVFETEPLPVDDPLWATRNLIISPHCSSVYAGWEEASFELFIDNLRRSQAGAPLSNVVDPVRGY